MTGRPDFSQPGSKRSGQTVAVQNRPEIQVIHRENTNNVEAGTKEFTEFYAPTGSTYRVLSWGWEAPSVGAATTGEHYVDVLPSDAGGAGGAEAITGASNYDTDLIWKYSSWASANFRQEPSSENAALNAVRGLTATENDPLVLVYNNSTDAAQTSTREMTFVVKEQSF